MRHGNIRRACAVALAMATATAISPSLSAHRRDEYLQAARLAIALDHVELHLDLTPGIAVADTIIGEIDHNRDGTLSTEEQQAYVQQVLEQTRLLLDTGEALTIQPVSSAFPDIAAFERGEGTIALEAAARITPDLPATTHQLTFRNAHHRDIGVYLANALVPISDRIVITSQQRDVDQHDLVINYDLQQEADAWKGALLTYGILIVTLVGPWGLRWWDRRRRRLEITR